MLVEVMVFSKMNTLDLSRVFFSFDKLLEIKRIDVYLRSGSSGSANANAGYNIPV